MLLLIYFYLFIYFFLLVIQFIHISVYMSIPISQFITPPHPPPAAFPPWCPYVCSLHLCLYFCSANRFICTIFQVPHICINIRYLFFSFRLTSLCMTVSRSIHVSTNDPIAFLFMADKYSIVYMYHFFFIHSSVDGHLGYFHDLAIVHSAAVNIGVQVSF